MQFRIAEHFLLYLDAAVLNYSLHLLVDELNKKHIKNININTEEKALQADRCHFTDNTKDTSGNNRAGLGPVALRMAVICPVSSNRPADAKLRS